MLNVAGKNVHYISFEVMNIISSAREDEYLFEMDRDEYIVHLTVDMVASIQKKQVLKN